MFITNETKDNLDWGCESDPVQVMRLNMYTCNSREIIRFGSSAKICRLHTCLCQGVRECYTIGELLERRYSEERHKYIAMSLPFLGQIRPVWRVVFQPE